MNAFDHVFRRSLENVSDSKIEGGTIGKIGCSKKVLSIFVTSDAMNRSSVCV